jgi:hypothetical protein
MGQPHRIVRMATAQDLPYLHRLARHVVHQLLGGHHLTAAQVRAATAARIFEVEPALVSAGTYYVAEIDGLVDAGSGWCEAWPTLLARLTETAATTAGYRRFEALCTPASEALRRTLGYRLVGRERTVLAGGVTVGVARMRKELTDERES